jgi:hypothetical protein
MKMDSYRKGFIKLTSAGFSLALCSILLLTSCSLWQPDRADPRSQSQPQFVPPTLAAAIPLESALVTPLPVAQVPGCTDSLKWLSDLTIPDGTFVQRGVTLEKQWEVENNGSCHWTKEYSLRLIGGPDLGANAQQSLYPAQSGTRAVIDIIFIAPMELGTYRTAWQAYNPSDQPFGDPIFMEIVVTDSNP